MANIFYYDTGDYLYREKGLKIIEHFGDVRAIL